MIFQKLELVRPVQQKTKLPSPYSLKLSKRNCPTLDILSYFKTTTFRNSSPEVFRKKGVLRNFEKFTGKHLCPSLFFKKDALAQVFSCEFCEISKNTFSYRTPPVVAFLLFKKLEERFLTKKDLIRNLFKVVIKRFGQFETRSDNIYTTSMNQIFYVALQYLKHPLRVLHN